MTTDLRQRTLSGLGWNTGAQVTKQLLQFLISVFLARLLTPDDFGLIGMIVIFTGFAALFSDMGLGPALIQRAQIDERHLSSSFWVNLAAGVSLTVIMIALAPVIARFYGEPALKPLTALVAFNFTLASLNVVQSALLSRSLAFRRLAAADLAATIVGGITAIGLAWRGAGVAALAWQTLTATLASVVIIWLLAHWRPRLLFSRAALRDLLGYSTHLTGFNVLNYWVRNADNLLIGRYIGSAALGIYARAYNTMLLPVIQVNAIISRVMFPTLSKLQADTPRVKRVYLRAVGLIAFVTFPLMAGMLAVSDSFVLAVYGTQWVAVIPVLRVLCLVGLVQSVSTTVGWLYQSQGRTDLMFRWGIVSGVISILAFVVGLRWGVMGVAVAYALRSFGLTYFNFSIPGSLIGMRFAEVARAVDRILLGSLTMAALVWGMGTQLPGAWGAWQRLIVQISLGVVLYAGFMLALRPAALRDLRALLAERRRKPSPAVGL